MGGIGRKISVNQLVVSSASCGVSLDGWGSKLRIAALLLAVLPLNTEWWVNVFFFGMRQSATTSDIKSVCSPVGVNSETTQPPNQATTSFGLVKGARLLELIFPEPDSRPSIRWLERHVRGRRIPSIKLGRLRFYSPEDVKRSLLERQPLRGGSN